MSENLIENIKNQEPTFLEKDKKKIGYVCPVCDSGTGAKGTGLIRNKHKPTQYKCFACGFSGDILDLIGAKFELKDVKDQIEKAKDIYKLVDLESEIKTMPKIEEPLKEKSLENEIQNYKKNNNFSYLLSRGISKAVQEHFSIGYCDKEKRLIIPTSPYSYSKRDITGKAENKYMKTGKTHIFNESVLDQVKSPIFIVEGEIDSMSIIEVGFNAIGLGSVSNIPLLLKTIKEHKAEDITYILLLDNDPVGIEAQERLKEALNTSNINNICVSFNMSDICNICNICDTHNIHDSNEYLMYDRQGFKDFLTKAFNKALDHVLGNEYNAETYLEYFKTIDKQEPLTEYKTGFKELDTALEGGFYEGLYILGAISSLGKTTFLLQVADNIAKSGKDVLFISLEMSAKELIAKSLSRLTYEDKRNTMKDKHYIARTTLQVLNANRHKLYSKEEKETFEKALKDYEAISHNMYIYEGRYNGKRLDVKAITEIVKGHVKKTGNKPIVIIDYLQILSPSDPRSTDKQNTDNAVFELKELSRTEHIPVVAISSFNRENYSKDVDMTAFKESGAIEYSSDVLLGLQYSNVNTKDFDKEKEAKKFDRDISLKVIKNRNGQAYRSIPFTFVSMFNYYDSYLSNSWNEYKEKRKSI